MNARSIEGYLRERFNISYLDVVDYAQKDKDSTMEDGIQFSILVVSDDFRDLKPVQRDEAIYNMLNTEFQCDAKSKVVIKALDIMEHERLK